MVQKNNKNKEQTTTNDITDQNTNIIPVKAKRGRKSKKELMASLNITYFLSNEKENKSTLQGQVQSQTSNIINLDVSEIENNVIDAQENNNLYENILNDENNISQLINTELTNIITLSEKTEEPKIAKKRGRKPKGGKIIQHITTNTDQKDEKSNVILHLKCSMKDLQTHPQNNSFLECYNFSTCKNDLNFELIGNENINYNNNTTSISTLDNVCEDYNDEDNDDEDSVCKDPNKEISKKLKQLEHNLHINNVNNKRSSCFWDTCEFDNPPIYIPKHFINGIYNVYGCFCSPECGVAYLMNENIDTSTKFERYHLFNHIYTKIYNYNKNIKPAPNPFYMLEKYYGNLSIQEYRSLLRNERLFLIVDKPLTRILPELHEDNDDFILNNKIIPSNNYNVKTHLLRKTQNKSSILTEKFGNNNQ